MEFLILGPLDVRDGASPVALGRGIQRSLLALLVVNANEPVASDHIVDALWNERPPATAHKAVQNHVSTLRRLLGEARLSTSPAGYTLHVADGELDVDRFEALVDRGRQHSVRSEHELAAELLREALSLWRGPALADVAYEGFAQTEIARLEERRLAALEARIEADLALGRYAEVTPELEALAGRHPTRERVQGQLMRALYGTGRQADALETYARARRALVDTLGIEPGPALQELQGAILRQDPALASQSPPLAAPAAPAPPPTPAVAPLAGRGRELGALEAGLETTFAGAGRVFLLAGEPGIGKSRLAEEIAASAQARGAVVLVGRAWEAGGAPAFWPWVQALRTLARGRSADALRAQAGGWGADLAQVLPELAELYPERSPAAPAEAEGARFRLFEGVAAFLRAAADDVPLVLVLDDLHAADTPSLLLFEFVGQQLGAARVFLLGTYRDTEVGADPLRNARPATRSSAAPCCGSARSGRARWHR